MKTKNNQKMESPLKKAAPLEKSRTSPPAAGTVTKPAAPAVAKPPPAMPAATGRTMPEKATLARAIPPSTPVKLSPARQTVTEEPAATPKAPAPTPTPVAHFEFNSPSAQAVSVAGSFNDWEPAATPMKKRGQGKWAADLTLQPGRYEYLFVVDGQWIEDPTAAAFAPNPFGGRNSVLQVKRSA